MTKNEAIDKISILIKELEKLQYSDDVIENEYKKWNRKSWRYIENIFGKNSQHISEQMNITFEDSAMYYGSANDDRNAFISGQKEMKSLLESFIEEIEEWSGTTVVKVAEQVEVKDKTKVFIVHGHDDALKEQIARFIEKLDLEAIILDERASGGKTIIEKIEHYSNVSFGIILYTECDIGGKDLDSLQPRARQNVVFEHGYLNGKIGRENVVALIKGNVEKPNDISGVVYISTFDNWQIKLAREMKESGYSINMDKIIS